MPSNVAALDSGHACDLRFSVLATVVLLNDLGASALESQTASLTPVSVLGPGVVATGLPSGHCRIKDTLRSWIPPKQSFQVNIGISNSSRRFTRIGADKKRRGPKTLANALDQESGRPAIPRSQWINAEGSGTLMIESRRIASLTAISGFLSPRRAFSSSDAIGYQLSG